MVRPAVFRDGVLIDDERIEGVDIVPFVSQNTIKVLTAAYGRVAKKNTTGMRDVSTKRLCQGRRTWKASKRTKVATARRKVF